MPRLKSPLSILFFICAITLTRRIYPQTAPPQMTPAQQSAASAQMAKDRHEAARAAKQAAAYKKAADQAATKAENMAKVTKATSNAQDIANAAANARQAANQAATYADAAHTAFTDATTSNDPSKVAQDAADARTAATSAGKAKDDATNYLNAANSLKAVPRTPKAPATVQVADNPKDHLAKEAMKAAASANLAEQAAKEAHDAANAARVARTVNDAETAANNARDEAAAAKAASDPKQALEHATKAATEAETAARAAAEAHTLANASSNLSTGCTAENDARVGIVNHWWRPQAGTDYFKLEYDVRNHQMRWFDYKKKWATGIEVLNGSILPVVYSREKVLVHVNCLHPTDTVSITTNDIALPEQGADIRGATAAATVTALAPTLDSLGTASAAGTALGTPGFGFGPPPALASGTTSLFTPGTSKDGTSYTDAVIGIAPEDLAIETNALVNQILDAINSYNELETGKLSNLKVNQFPDVQSAANLLKDCSTPPADPDLPGSVCGLQAATAALITKLSPPVSLNDNTLSAFNDHLAQTQTLVSQLNGLAGGLNQAGLAARAIAIRQNMEAIVGLLAEVSNAYTDDLKYNKNHIISIDAKQTITTDATCQEVYDAIYSGSTVPAKQGTQTVNTNPPDTPVCHAMEQYTLDRFLRRYDEAIQKLKDSSFHLMSATLNLRLPDLQNAVGSAILDPQVSATDKAALKDLKEELRGFSDGTKAAPPATDKDFTALITNSETLQSEPIPAESVRELSSLSTDVAPNLYKSKAYPSLSQPPDKKTGWVVDTDPTQNAANQLFKALLAMRSKVADLDQNVGKLFAQMNSRYQDTWVDQTDALPPLTSNTIVRIGINVQRNYTPFTLTGGSAVGTLAATTSQAASANPSGGQQGAGQGGGQQGGGQQAGGKGQQSTGQQSANQSSTTSSSGATSTTGSNDFTVLMEVHRFANFNLVGGIMGIRVKNYSFASVPEYASFAGVTATSTGTATSPQYTYTAYVTCPVGTNVMATTAGAVPINATSTSASVTPSPSLYYCLQQTQTASLQPAGMVGIAWFPWHRDYFPRGRGALFQARDLIPSLMAASSVTSLGSVFFGPNIEPFNGIDIFGGWGTANVTGLAKGTSLNQVFFPVGSSSTAPTINTATHVKGGITFGIGFDISVFLQLFGKTQGPSLP